MCARIAALAALLAAACSGPAPRTPAPGLTPHLRQRERQLEYPGPGESAPEPANLKEVAIAWFGPSDPDHPLAGGMWRAATMAVREANARGGYRGLPFRLLPCWSANPWGSGIATLTRMVYEKRIWAILGSIDGPATHLAEQVVAKAALPLVSPVSTDKSLTLAGVSWIFSASPSDDAYAPLLARAAREALKAGPGKGLTLISATDHDSRLAAIELQRAFNTAGLVLSYHLEFRPNERDFSTLLATLRAAPPRVLVLDAGPRDAARIVLALRALPFQGALLATPQLGRAAFAQLADTAAAGIRLPALATTNRADPITRAFLEHFRAASSTPPDADALLTYDATRLLIAAIRKAGLNRTRIRAALASLSPWSGIAGSIHFDGTGRNQRQITRLVTLPSTF